MTELQKTFGNTQICRLHASIKPISGRLHTFQNSTKTVQRNGSLLKYKRDNKTDCRVIFVISINHANGIYRPIYHTFNYIEFIFFYFAQTKFTKNSSNTRTTSRLFRYQIKRKKSQTTTHLMWNEVRFR